MSEKGLSSRQTPSKEVSDLLRRRARELAESSLARPQAKETIEVVVFQIDQEQYALELAHIQEVYPLKDLTAIPGVPTFVLGVINVRGRIVSVVDIRQFFDIPHQGFTNLNRIIILESAQMAFGILADDIKEVRTIRRSEIQPALPTLTGIREAFLLGVGDDHTVILDGARILASPTLIIDQKDT
ncbi:MAG: purine-binding chemotaxis protein CheW [Magnetococcales bacterium]|nr:purine-binding chemotaxis protein CheW [Magnetococcales bacterium]